MSVPDHSQAAPLTPHLDYMPSADAYRLGCEETERRIMAGLGDAHDQLVAPHVHRLNGILERIDGIEAYPRLEVVEGPGEHAFPVWEDEAIALANAWAA